MTDRGIIFSDAMVSALRAGRKTQTRRLKGIPGVKPGDRFYVRETFAPRSLESADVPKIKAADYVLLVDGAAVRRDGTSTPPIANLTERGKMLSGVKWCPCIHMPRWASRITLTVTAVRREHLAFISNRDAAAEGVEFESADPPFYYVPGIDAALTAVEIREGEKASYAKLWDLLHTEPNTRVADNPLVAVYEFTVRLGNIDRGEGA